MDMKQVHFVAVALCFLKILEKTVNYNNSLHYKYKK